MKTHQESLLLGRLNQSYYVFDTDCIRGIAAFDEMTIESSSVNNIFGSLNYLHQKIALLDPKAILGEPFNKCANSSVIVVFDLTNGIAGLPLEELISIEYLEQAITMDIDSVKKILPPCFASIVEIGGQSAYKIDMKKVLTIEEQFEIFRSIISQLDVFEANFVIIMSIVEYLSSKLQLAHQCQYDPDQSDASKTPTEVYEIIHQLLNLFNIETPQKQTILATDCYFVSKELVEVLKGYINDQYKFERILTKRSEIFDQTIENMNRDIVPGDVFQIVSGIKESIDQIVNMTKSA